MWVRRVGWGWRGPAPKMMIGMDGTVQTEWQTCWSVAKASRERCHDRERRRKSEGAERNGEAMPAVERLGRASPPLSVWLRAAAPEEIKKWPGVAAAAVALVDGDKLCLGSGKDEGEKKFFQTSENLASEKGYGNQKTKTSDFLFLIDIPHWSRRTPTSFRRQSSA